MSKTKAFNHILPTRVLDYLESLELLGESRGSYTTNRRHLFLFTEYLEDTPLEAVRHKEAQGFIIWLAENYSEYTAGTISNILKSLRKFYRREKDLNHIFEDPFLYVIPPRVSKILPRNVPKDRDVKKIISVIPKGNYRDRSIIELLYGSGLRAGELLSLTIKSINYKNSTVRVIDSKSKKERVVPINDLTAYSLKDYIRIERPKLLTSKPLQIKPNEIRGKAEDIVFLKRGGFKLCSWSLSEIIEKYRNEAGLDSRLTPHSFRHACATEMLKGGASIRHIQVMLGHDSISTTMIYTRLGVDELRLELDKVHPHGGRV